MAFLSGPAPLRVHRLFIDARFPRHVAVLDFMGRLADEMESDFSEISLLSGMIRLENPERRTEVAFAPDRLWINQAYPVDSEFLLGIVDQGILTLAKYVDLSSLEFLGVRQMLQFPLSRVSEATSLFRHTFFEYRAPPFTQFGEEPVEAQAIFAYRLTAGDLCRVQATSIFFDPRDDSPKPVGDVMEAASEDELRVPPSAQVVKVEHEPAGALVLDVDRTNDAGVPVWEASQLAKELLTDGRRRALDFLAALELPGSLVEESRG